MESDLEEDFIPSHIPDGLPLSSYEDLYPWATAAPPPGKIQLACAER